MWLCWPLYQVLQRCRNQPFSHYRYSWAEYECWHLRSNCLRRKKIYVYAYLEAVQTIGKTMETMKFLCKGRTGFFPMTGSFILLPIPKISPRPECHGHQCSKWELGWKQRWRTYWCLLQRKSKTLHWMFQLWCSEYISKDCSRSSTKMLWMQLVLRGSQEDLLQIQKDQSNWGWDP